MRSNNRAYGQNIYFMLLTTQSSTTIFSQPVKFVIFFYYMWVPGPCMLAKREMKALRISSHGSPGQTP